MGVTVPAGRLRREPHRSSRRVTDGEFDEGESQLRAAGGGTGGRLGEQLPLARHPSATTRPPRWCGFEVRCDPECTLARAGAAKLWQRLHTMDYVHALGAMTGGQAIQFAKGGAARPVPVGLAGGGRRQPRRAGLPRPVPVPGRLRPVAGGSPQQRADAGRPDRVERDRGQPESRLHAAHRGRCRGGLRRSAQRLRTDEGDDRVRCGRRSLRGPAQLGQEVRPHGREGAGADRAACLDAQGGQAGRRRHGGRDPPDRPHRRVERRPHHQRCRRPGPGHLDR